MKIARNLDSLRERVAAWRQAGECIAFVPTMGNLHDGHLRLVEAARERADRVVVSVFVNPTQFGPGEDYDSYPRTEDEDIRQLVAAGTDLLLLPDVETMYPGGTEAATVVDVPGLSGELCGASRPGHFRGVATVVARLFNMVQPDVAVFGEKDFQQLLVIRRMVRDLHFPVEIVGIPTHREDDGLAMSSRNRYLEPDERDKAPLLHATLRQCADDLAAGDEPAAVEVRAMKALEAGGFSPEYVSVRSADDLGKPSPETAELVVLAAAKLGRARLIDNLRVDRKTES